MDTLRFWLNGQWIEESSVPPTTTLLQYLRQNKRLTGTKEGCAEGDCGACTVIVIDKKTSDKPRFRAINSCLLLLPMLQGSYVLTVEALETNGTPHIVQESLVQELGSQCGYCTPGFIMSMFEACYRPDLDEDWKLDDQLCGNLCRCTGYRPILDATKAIAGTQPQDSFSSLLQDATPEPMSLSYQHGEQKYFNPTSLDTLWELLETYPDARFIVGGTDLSLEITKQFKEPQLLISLEGLGLSEIEEKDDYWRVGATTTLSRLEAALAQPFPTIERMVRFFGARQIKNRGTLGGNICTASPIGDLAPVLLSLNARAVLLSKQGERIIPLSEFFVGYRQTALQQGEILAAVEIPSLQTEQDIRSCSYKVSKRQELDISTVSAGLYVHISKDGEVVEARFGFGGMAATPSRATQLEQALVGKTWSEETLEAALPTLAQDFTPIDGHRGSAWYRNKVAQNLIMGFFLETQNEPQPRLPYRPTATVNLETTP